MLLAEYLSFQEKSENFVQILPVLLNIFLLWRNWLFLGKLWCSRKFLTDIVRMYVCFLKKDILKRMLCLDFMLVCKSI